MAVPERQHQAGTFFITAVCAERRRIFQDTANAQLLWDHLQENRGRAYLLHAFVIMPEHTHLLLTPTQSLEYAMQIVKGGFSRKYGVATGRRTEVWQRGFTDHRIRDREDLFTRKFYIGNNPVGRGLCASPGAYRWSSATKRTSGLKPRPQRDRYGTAKAVPFQPIER